MKKYVIRIGKELREMSFEEIVGEFDGFLKYESYKTTLGLLQGGYIDQEDIYQEYLIRMYETIDGYNNKYHYNTFLGEIIRQTDSAIIKYVTAQKRDIKKEEDNDLISLEEKLKPVVRSSVKKVIIDYSSSYKEAICIAYLVGEISIDNAAKKLGIKKPTMYQWVREVKQELKQYCQQELKIAA